MIKHPMLSGKAPEDLSTLKYPVAVSPKLDGFRALVIDGVVMSRNLKPIRNKHVQKLFGKPEFNGYDGELIVGDPTAPDCFNKTSSGVTRADGEPDVTYCIFDRTDMTGVGWSSRFETLTDHDNVLKVKHTLALTETDILEEEERFLNQGYEGLMIRGITSPYKEGRSTTREGWLLKLKRFQDDEALVIGMEEKMHNANEATKNALGHTERSSHQENLVPMDTMGALVVRDLKTGVVFNIGTGLDDGERAWWWALMLKSPGSVTIGNNGGRVFMFLTPELILKYKHFAIGAKDKPRFPASCGIRDKDDL